VRCTRRPRPLASPPQPHGWSAPQVKFVYDKDAAEEFSKVFDLSLLSPELGGSGELVPVQGMWQTILAEEEAQQRGQQGQQEGAQAQ
jgi:hypothetical protein